MGPDEVVACARGMSVAQRQAGTGREQASLRVGNVAPVDAPAHPPFEARLPNGTVWRRHWAEAHRLVVDFLGVARVEVQDGSGTVVFDRPLSDQMEQHLLLDHVLPLVLARAGEVVLHGGVVSRSGRAVVLIGSTGAGKSTLTAFAGQRGWSIGGDDGAVLTATKPPSVEPTYATVRLTPAGAQLLGIAPDAGSAVLGKMRLEQPPLCRQSPVPLHLIALLQPVPAGAAARWEPFVGVEAHARLLSSTFHADFSAEYLPTVVRTLGSIVDSVVVGRLNVPRGWNGLAEAEDLLRALLAVSPVGPAPLHEATR